MRDYPQLPYPALPVLTDAERLARARASYERLRTRRTCRFFTDAPVPRRVIEQAILAAGTAPSGANHQPWHFAAISSLEAKREVRRLAEEEEREFYAGKASDEWLEALAPLGTDDVKPYLETAPWLIAVFGQRRGGPNPGDNRQNYYVTESVGIAVGLLLATLHEAGLATLTHTPAPMKFLNAICQRPSDEKPMMLVVVGHPAPDATVPAHAVQRKPIGAISSWI
ncbi:MAG: nitroreductase family protein [Novosphingobium sp.]|uniref:nitroreductase family protein n=1 Tax=Novosphingobium sp. TaxID=1874826 RepID=UPI001DCB4575|nr:nitroreductase family protein [Novosphingobium sp.]MCB2056792.1 nitroreductase family protein [Novosphingobium sp.]MCP5387016.1 nitroreductase family protein [Novosphingobium sp.]